LTPTNTPAPPPPPPDPCKIKKGPPGTNKRWYAIAVTTTTKDKAWFGASVEWTYEPMFVGPGLDQFIDETLWVGTENAQKCWIETGDGDGTDANGVHTRAYYWAENTKTTGYDEYAVNGVPYPALGQYQRYTIFHQVGGAYMILIGGIKVGWSDQGGDTLFAHAGLETTTPASRIKGSVKFRNFEVHDGNGFVPWPNHRPDMDFPAWWRDTWPTPSNGIPFPFFIPLGE
jgi:hypothetical protein